MQSDSSHAAHFADRWLRRKRCYGRGDGRVSIGLQVASDVGAIRGVGRISVRDFFFRGGF